MLMLTDKPGTVYNTETKGLPPFDWPEHYTRWITSSMGRDFLKKKVSSGDTSRPMIDKHGPGFTGYPVSTMPSLVLEMENLGSGQTLFDPEVVRTITFRFCMHLGMYLQLNYHASVLNTTICFECTLLMVDLFWFCSFSFPSLFGLSDFFLFPPNNIPYETSRPVTFEMSIAANPG